MPGWRPTCAWVGRSAMLSSPGDLVSRHLRISAGMTCDVCGSKPVLSSLEGLLRGP